MSTIWESLYDKALVGPIAYRFGSFDINTGDPLPKKSPDNPQRGAASVPMLRGVLNVVSGNFSHYGYEQTVPATNNKLVVRWPNPADPKDIIHSRANFTTREFETTHPEHALTSFAMMGIGAAINRGIPAFKDAWSAFLANGNRVKTDAITLEVVSEISDIVYGALRYGAKWPKKNGVAGDEPTDDWTIRFVKKDVLDGVKITNIRNSLAHSDDFDVLMELNLDTSNASKRTRFQGEQLEHVQRFLERKKHIALLGPPGCGKALALDTPIPTPWGWTTMGDIRVGDTVLDENGKPCVVTHHTKIMPGRPCYEVEFSDGSIIVADENHEWYTQNRNSRAAKAKGKNMLGKIRTTRQIAATLKVERGNRLNHSIPVAKALDLYPMDLPIEPYTLGVWLGDGDSNGATLTCAEPELAMAVVDAGCSLSQHSDPTRYGMGLGTIRGLTKSTGKGRVNKQYFPGNNLTSMLRVMGLLHNKHIPGMYLRASIDQRLSVLQGLMDTDGYMDRNGGNAEFTSTLRTLAENTLELILSLGMQPTMAEGRAVLDGRDIGPKWRINFRPTVQVFRLPRKANTLNLNNIRPTVRNRYITAVSSVPSVPVKCIQVSSESHLYLAGRTMIPTHNSLCAFEVFRISGFERKGVDYQLFTCHEEVKSSDLIGAWQPNGKGTFDWVDGPLVRAMTANGGKGQPMLVEEFTRMPTKSQNIFISVLSDGYLVRNEKPGEDGIGELVLAGPDFVLLTDMNVDPAVDDIDLYGAAFARRVRKIEFSYPKLDMLQRILRSETGCSQTVASAAGKVYDHVMKLHLAHEVAHPINPGSMVQWIEDYQAMLSDGQTERISAQQSAKHTWLRDVAGTEEPLRNSLLNEIEAAFRVLEMSAAKTTSKGTAGSKK